jgi:ATP-dependent protease ClpP protease subunit
MFFRVDKVRKAYDNFTMDVDVVGRKIIVDGAIGPSFSSKLKKNLDLYAGIDTIVITSPGGLVDQALKAAEIIEQNPQIRVVAKKECNSSCIVILMSAEKRYADWNMNLGFHAVSPITKLPDSNNEIAQLGTEADKYLIKRGVSEEILNHAFASKEGDLKLVPAINLAVLGSLNGLLDNENAISINAAKWRVAEDSLKIAETKVDVPLSDLLKTIIFISI